jgi:hypothetical protein
VEKGNVTQISMHIPEGMRAETNLIKQSQVPRHFRMGNGKRNTFMGKESLEPIDAINAMAAMSAQELWATQLIKDNLILIEVLTYDGRIQKKTSCKAIVKSSELTDAEKQKFKTGFKRLHSKNLIRRVKREHYIFNPMFLIPHFFDDESALFKSLK